MGIDAADYDGIGLPSLFVTNYENEKHALYHNDWKAGTDAVERQFFRHCTSQSKINSIGQSYVGWGTGFVDLENRGWEDIVIINGHVIRFPAGSLRDGKYIEQRPQRPVLLRNQGDGTFSQFTPRGGKFFEERHPGRGVAFGDLDNDGRVDMVVSRVNAPVAIVRNISASGNHWLGVELIGKDRRDIVGARLGLKAEKRTLWRFCKGGGSYASTRDPRHVFGLGQETQPGPLTVFWPDGTEQSFTDLKADRYYRITQGEASPKEVSRPREK
jgi:hypothetical protein